MREKKVVAIAVATVVLLGAAWHAIAQDAKAPYPSMAPLDQYLMEDRGAEIALARGAAPESISRDAEVLVLGRHGYEAAIKGTNGFVYRHCQRTRRRAVCETGKAERRSR
jgi:hypothetical protein